MKRWVLKSNYDENYYQCLHRCYGVSRWKRGGTRELAKARIFHTKSGATNAARWSHGGFRVVEVIFAIMEE